MSSRAPTDPGPLTHPLAPPSETGDAARASLRTWRGISPPSGVDIEETFLSNGIHVLSERIPAVRSAAVGVWVRQGSVHEGEDELGLSHLLEHMVFKGTSRRSAREIAGALEDLGGSLDAYTTCEHTSFQARVLGEHLSEAMDVLSDLVLSPLLRDADLELEREVVLEEISAVEDTPDDLVFELHGEMLWQGHGYGHSILGTRASVGGASADDLRALHGRKYGGRNLVVAAAGRVDHGELVELARRWFGGAPDLGGEQPLPEPSGVRRGQERVVRESLQTHVVFGSDLVPHSDKRRYGLVLLSAAFGGGMSSRLFQRVREELGLAYTVFSFQSFYSAAGCGGVYVGTRPGWAEKAVAAILEEYRRLAIEGLPAEELERTKRQVKGQILLSLESTASRLYRLAGFALRGEAYLDIDSLLARIDAVSVEEAKETAADFFAPERQFMLCLGPAPGGTPEKTTT